VLVLVLLLVVLFVGVGACVVVGVGVVAGDFVGLCLICVGHILRQHVPDYGRCATFGRVCGRPCQSPMPADEHGPLTGKVARSGSPVEKHTEASVCDDDILNTHPI
jgi:hypothetical protein